MARRLLGSKAGESLVELAVSIAILSLIVLWAVSAFGAYAKTGQDLDLVSQAVSLADSKIETLKTYTLAQLKLELNLNLPPSGETGVVTEFNLSDTYRCTVVSSDQSHNNITLIEITMTVFDKANGTSVYVVKTSFLRGAGGQNVGD
ncbi:MAG: hypothetical protein WC625_02035 [Caldisericia bacterium]